MNRSDPPTGYPNVDDPFASTGPYAGPPETWGDVSTHGVEINRDASTQFAQRHRALRKRVSTFVATLAALTSVLVLSSSAWSTEAAKPPRPLQINAPRTVALPVLKDLNLKSTTISSGNQVVQVPPGDWTPVNAPVSVSCPERSAPCTVEADQNVEATGVRAGQVWTICTKVDGRFMPECPFTGDLVDDNFGTGSFTSYTTGLKSGGHTVRTFLLVDDPTAYFGDFTIDYRVYSNN